MKGKSTAAGFASEAEAATQGNGLGMNGTPAALFHVPRARRMS